MLKVMFNFLKKILLIILLLIFKFFKLNIIIFFIFYSVKYVVQFVYFSIKKIFKKLVYYALQKFKVINVFLFGFSLFFFFIKNILLYLYKVFINIYVFLFYMKIYFHIRLFSLYFIIIKLNIRFKKINLFNKFNKYIYIYYYKILSLYFLKFLHKIFFILFFKLFYIFQSFYFIIISLIFILKYFFFFIFNILLFFFNIKFYFLDLIYFIGKQIKLFFNKIILFVLYLNMKYLLYINKLKLLLKKKLPFVYGYFFYYKPGYLLLVFYLYFVLVFPLLQWYSNDLLYNYFLLIEDNWSWYGDISSVFHYFYDYFFILDEVYKNMHGKRVFLFRYGDHGDIYFLMLFLSILYFLVFLPKFRHIWLSEEVWDSDGDAIDEDDEEYDEEDEDDDMEAQELYDGDQQGEDTVEYVDSLRNKSFVKARYHHFNYSNGFLMSEEVGWGFFLFFWIFSFYIVIKILYWPNTWGNIYYAGTTFEEMFTGMFTFIEVHVSSNLYLHGDWMPGYTGVSHFRFVGRDREFNYNRMAGDYSINWVIQNKSHKRHHLFYNKFYRKYHFSPARVGSLSTYKINTVPFRSLNKEKLLYKKRYNSKYIMTDVRYKIYKNYPIVYKKIKSWKRTIFGHRSLINILYNKKLYLSYWPKEKWEYQIIRKKNFEFFFKKYKFKGMFQNSFDIEIKYKKFNEIGFDRMSTYLIYKHKDSLDFLKIYSKRKRKKGKLVNHLGGLVKPWYLWIHCDTDNAPGNNLVNKVYRTRPVIYEYGLTPFHLDMKNTWWFWLDKPLLKDGIYSEFFFIYLRDLKFENSVYSKWILKKLWYNYWEGKFNVSQYFSFLNFNLKHFCENAVLVNKLATIALKNDISFRDLIHLRKTIDFGDNYLLKMRKTVGIKRGRVEKRVYNFKRLFINLIEPGVWDLWKSRLDLDYMYTNTRILSKYNFKFHFQQFSFYEKFWRKTPLSIQDHYLTHTSVRFSPVRKKGYFDYKKPFVYNKYFQFYKKRSYGFYHRKKRSMIRRYTLFFYNKRKKRFRLKTVIFQMENVYDTLTLYGNTLIKKKVKDYNLYQLWGAFKKNEDFMAYGSVYGLRKMPYNKPIFLEVVKRRKKHFIMMRDRLVINLYLLRFFFFRYDFFGSKDLNKKFMLNVLLNDNFYFKEWVIDYIFFHLRRLPKHLPKNFYVDNNFNIQQKFNLFYLYKYTYNKYSLSLIKKHKYVIFTYLDIFKYYINFYKLCFLNFYKELLGLGVREKIFYYVFYDPNFLYFSKSYFKMERFIIKTNSFLFYKKNSERLENFRLKAHEKKSYLKNIFETSIFFFHLMPEYDYSKFIVDFNFIGLGLREIYKKDFFLINEFFYKNRHYLTTPYFFSSNMKLKYLETYNINGLILYKYFCRPFYFLNYDLISIINSIKYSNFSEKFVNINHLLLSFGDKPSLDALSLYYKSYELKYDVYEKTEIRLLLDRKENDISSLKRYHRFFISDYWRGQPSIWYMMSFDKNLLQNKNFYDLKTSIFKNIYNNFEKKSS